MKLDQPINEIIEQPTVKMTFAEMQRKLLGEFSSSVKALDIGFATFLEQASETLGTLYPAQHKFLNDMHNELQIPNAVIDVKSARQVGTTTGLMLIAYYQMLYNPHQTIAFLYHNQAQAREVCKQLSNLSSMMQAEHNHPKVFTKFHKDYLVTPHSGRIMFVSARSIDNLRGNTISKIFAEDYNMYNTESFEQAIIPLMTHCGADLITTNVGVHARLPSNVKRVQFNREWDDNPNHDLEFFDNMRAIMPSDQFNLEMNL